EQLAQPRFEAKFEETPKLIARKKKNGLHVHRDDIGYVATTGVSILKPRHIQDINYYLGVLNSKLVSWWIIWRTGRNPNIGHATYILDEISMIPFVMPPKRPGPLLMLCNEIADAAEELLRLNTTRNTVETTPLVSWKSRIEQTVWE